MSCQKMEEEERLLDKEEKRCPPDRFNMVYIIFYILGVGSLLPWNFFITAKDFFHYKLRNTSLPAGTSYDAPAVQTELQTLFESYLAIASTITNILFNILTVLLVKQIGQKKRLTVSLLVIIMLFILTVSLVNVKTDSFQQTFFAIIICIIIILSAASAVLSGSLLGLVSLFPSSFMEAAMSGQALGGTLAAVANIISKASSDSVQTSAIGFFLSAAAITVIALIGYFMLHFNSFARYYMCEKDFEIPHVQVEKDLKASLHVSIYNILKQIWSWGLTVFLIFVVTLAVFPSVAAAIMSVQMEKQSHWSKTYFSPLVCFLCFNIGDLGGRIICGNIQMLKPKNTWIPILVALSRIAFIPLIMLCNAQPRYRLPVVFDNDVYPVVFIVLMGLTNGYFGTLAMMNGPQLVVNTNDVERAGAFMSLFLTCGLGVGSLFSLLLVKSL